MPVRVAFDSVDYFVFIILQTAYILRLLWSWYAHYSARMQWALAFPPDIALHFFYNLRL